MGRIGRLAPVAFVSKISPSVMTAMASMSGMPNSQPQPTTFIDPNLLSEVCYPIFWTTHFSSATHVNGIIGLSALWGSRWWGMFWATGPGAQPTDRSIKGDAWTARSSFPV